MGAEVRVNLMATCAVQCVVWCVSQPQECCAGTPPPTFPFPKTPTNPHLRLFPTSHTHLMPSMCVAVTHYAADLRSVSRSLWLSDPVPFCTVIHLIQAVRKL